MGHLWCDNVCKNTLLQLINTLYTRLCYILSGYNVSRHTHNKKDKYFGKHAENVEWSVARNHFWKKITSRALKLYTRISKCGVREPPSPRSASVNRVLYTTIQEWDAWIVKHFVVAFDTEYISVTIKITWKWIIVERLWPSYIGICRWWNTSK